MYIFKQHEPNKVPSDINNLLLDLFDKSSSEVRKKIAVVITSIYSVHFDRFFIKKLICEYSMQDSLSLIISNNFIKNPDATWELLDSWFTPLKNETDSENINSKEKLINAGLKSLEVIYNSDIKNNNLNKEKLVDQLNNIFTQNSNEKIRIKVLPIVKTKISRY